MRPLELVFEALLVVLCGEKSKSQGLNQDRLGVAIQVHAANKSGHIPYFEFASGCPLGVHTSI